METTEQLILERVDETLAQALEKPRANQPFVTLTFAQSLDGSIAIQAGQPLALSNVYSRTMTHHLRARHDAILVGINTVLADDPRLTVRLVKGTSPRPVIVDSQLRFPLQAKLRESREIGPIVATGINASESKERALRAAGVQVLRIPTEKNGRLNLALLLAELAGLGIRSLMVEGGAQIITSFLTHGLADQIILTVCPVLVGGLRGVNPTTKNEIRSMPTLENVYYHKLGDDVIVIADLVQSGAR